MAAAIPEPAIGLVVRYDFLWPDEVASGRVSGRERAACVILIIERQDFPLSPFVAIAPITHSPPAEDAYAVEIPAVEKRRLGLDDERSWIVLDTLNKQEWPNGLVRTRSRTGSFFYGTLSLPLIRQIREKMAAAARARRVSIVPRS